MSATTKAKLPPMTVTITDQRVLKRLHKTAERLRYKPAKLGQIILTSGLWEWDGTSR